MNVLADALSRLPSFSGDKGMEGKSAAPATPPVPLEDAMHFGDLYECLRYLPEMDSYFAISDHMLNLPPSSENPLNFEWIRDTQEASAELRRKCGEGISGFSRRKFDGIDLICFTDKGQNEDENWKICLTDEAVRPAIAWFHQVLGHPGRDRLYEAMHRYFHPELRKIINQFKCDACQRYKAEGRGFGHLAPREVRTAPWEQVDVDLIGPWKITTRTNRTYEFLALTCIDRVTGLAE